MLKCLYVRKHMNGRVEESQPFVYTKTSALEEQADEYEVYMFGKQ